MSGVEDLEELEKDQLLLAESCNDVLWKQRWIERAQATRIKIEILKKD